MRTFKVLLAVCLTLGQPLAWANTQSDAREALILRSVRFYNSFQSAGHLINLMKANAGEADRAFLISLEADTLKTAPPEAAVKGRDLYVTGLKKPILILDINSGRYSYEGRGFTFDHRGGLEKSFKEMERAIFPAKVSLFDLILPKAHAVSKSQKQLLTMTMGLMGIAGMMQCFAQMSGGQPPPPPKPQPQPQFVQLPNGDYRRVDPQPQIGGCGMAVFGLLGMLMAMGIDPEDKPQEIKCTVDMNGARTLVVNGVGGAPLTAPYVQQPGRPVIFPPTMTGSQATAAAQINQFCMNPMALQAANQALQAPYVIPPVTAYNTPPSAPSKPVVTTPQSVKDDRTPAEEGDARFAPAGSAGLK